MPRYRVLVSTYKSDEMSIDRVTNTFYLEDHGINTDADNLAEDTAELWATFRTWPSGWNRVNVRLYDMAEPTPREIQGEFTRTTVNSANQPSGPREVACCLSFYADRNLPRNRGRLYIGPWQVGQMQERPDPIIAAWLGNLRQGLADLGGVDVVWSVYSPTDSIGESTPVFKPVTAGWIDDEWDTIRSRGLRAVVRNPWTMEG